MPTRRRTGIKGRRNKTPTASISMGRSPARPIEDETGTQRDLERLVDERTRELFIVNEQLRREISFRKKIEEELSDSQDRFRCLYETSRMREHLYHSFLIASPDAIVIYDEQGRARYVSPSFTRLFGWTSQEVEGIRIPYVPDSEMDSTKHLIDRVMREGLALSGIEGRRYTKDGQLLTVSMSAARYYDDLGVPIGIMVILRDVSEPKRMEQALAASEERFRTLAHVSPFGLALIAANETTEYINPKFTEIFGYTIEDIPNLESWFQKAYPNGNHWKHVTALWRQETAAIEPKGIGGAETLPRTLVLICNNSEQRIVHFRAVVLADGRLIATFLDITEEARAQAELLRAKDEWERTFDAVSDLIFILDDQRTIVRVNRALAEKLGVPPASLSGLACDAALGGNQTLAPLCPDLLPLAEGQEHQSEVVDEGLGGVFDLRISPLRDREGRISGAVHVARDLTPFKSLERARRLAVHHLAHELSTPVAVMQASLRKLMESEIPAEVQKVRIERVSRNLQRLKEIQRAVVEIVSPPRYCPRPFSVRAQVRQVIQEISTQSAHRDTILRTSVLCDKCHAIDPDIFTLALHTLLKNAIENTPDEGEVSVSLDESVSGLLLQVEDTGVGIPTRDHAFIFDAFHHTQTTGTYSTRKPFDFDAGGKGLELMRLRMLSESCFFTISFLTRRCPYVQEQLHPCPGRVSACTHVSGLDDCRNSGGTTFSVLFRNAEP